MSTAPHVVISDVTRVHGTGETAVTRAAPASASRSTPASSSP